MKKLSILMVSILALPTYGQSLLSTLNQYQGTLRSQPSASSPSSTPSDVKPTSQVSSSSVKKCEENDQTSLPLSYVTSLILEKDAALDILHDPRAGSLTVSAGDMIGNCSSMLEWNLKQPEIHGKKAYAIEVNIKKGEGCTGADGCSYKVAKVSNGEFQNFETMKFKPTLKGFEECLQKSGVIDNGRVVSGAIYSTPVKEKFNKVDESGSLLFLSHGPSSSLVKAKYGKFDYQDGCDYYESAHPNVKSLLTYEDSERARLDAEADKLKDCKVDEYQKLAEFIEKYEGYAAILGDVRDRLILEAAKKSAEAIKSGKYTEDDLKVIGDFDRYVVQPKVELARALYEEMLELEGDAKKAKQAELAQVLAQISSYKKAPYFISAHTSKLIQDGRFDEAEKVNSLLLTLDSYQRLGAKQDNVVITPEVATKKILAGRLAFSKALESEKEKYEIRTGQVTGKSDDYAATARRLRRNIEVRTKNYQAEMEIEYERIVYPNGYCYKYWRNTQACIQDTRERLVQLSNLLSHYNNVDKERAEEFDELAKQYGDLEAQGRRYVAAQNGEEPAPEETSTEVEEDTTAPVARAEDNSVYNFDFNQGQMNQQQQMAYQQQMQQQAMMTPQNYQNPMNPYGNNNMFMPQQQQQFGYQPSYMGAQNYMNTGYPQGGYSFNWGGGMQQQQMYPQQMYAQPQIYPQQQGYWGNPNQAFNTQNLIYGRTW